MNNHRREQFFRAQQAARARDRMLERYIAERIAKQTAGQLGGQKGPGACTSHARTRAPSQAWKPRPTQEHAGLAA